ncbi:MAG: DNA replication/repair protein RecF [Actinomycetales bacterium]|nr:DNA replication/repair protein RecF [Actinomycetales bacterium]
MKISHLSLQDFRSYKNLELPLNEGTHIFIGENGEGKTNIVEAIMYLALLSSHRISTDAPLIKLGAERGYIRAKVSDQDRDTLIELEINNGKANRAKVNQNPVRSQRAISGIVKAICFSPEDLDLVRGDPSERRSFLDHLLIQRNPRLGGVISDYEKALKQRNTLLKARAPESTLAPWNEHLANFGGEIIAARLKLIRELIPHLMNSYENISVKKQPSLEYKSNLDNLTEDKEDNKSEILRKIEEVGFQERERGVSLVGPHRDDLLLNLGEHPVKGFASHGESWSIALSLRLASYQLLKSDGDNPILILDDVFSELDEKRRERLVALTNTAEQTLITVAVANDLPSELTGSRYQVANGLVTAL